MGSCVSTALLCVGAVIGLIHNKISARRRNSGDAVFEEERMDLAVDLDQSCSDSDTLHEAVVIV